MKFRKITQAIRTVKNQITQNTIESFWLEYLAESIMAKSPVATLIVEKKFPTNIPIYLYSALGASKFI